MSSTVRQQPAAVDHRPTRADEHRWERATDVTHLVQLIDDGGQVRRSRPAQGAEQAERLAEELRGGRHQVRIIARPTTAGAR